MNITFEYGKNQRVQIETTAKVTKPRCAISKFYMTTKPTT